MARLMEFKMERSGLVQTGQEVEIREGTLPNSVFYYVIEPAVAMSGNFPLGQRLLARKGIVTDIKENERGYYVTVSFEDSSPSSSKI